MIVVFTMLLTISYSPPEKISLWSEQFSGIMSVESSTKRRKTGTAHASVMYPDVSSEP